MSPTPFEVTHLKGMTLRNRFVRSATAEGMATAKGEVTPRLIKLMEELAEGGVGLIITGHAYVTKRGQANPAQLGIYDDHLIAGLRQMVEAVHKRGGRIAVQLAHAGFLAIPKLINASPQAPSAIPGLVETPLKEMTIKDIKETIDAFVAAAVRAKEACFDGVQIHAAHSYLLSQFLSPAYNKRKDAYGGGIEGRTRIVREIVEAIRVKVGTDYPILVKINGRDYLEGGLELDDSLEAGRIIQEAGADAIEVSGGTFASGNLMPVRKGIAAESQEAYFKSEALAFKRHLDLPIILVGGIRSFSVAQRLLKEGIADYISLSRPFIREPGLINRWRAGDLRRADCLSDSRCLRPALAGKGVFCVTKGRPSEQ